VSYSLLFASIKKECINKSSVSTSPHALFSFTRKKQLQASWWLRAGQQAVSKKKKTGSISQTLGQFNWRF
jgi:hypothetical protein